MDALFSRQPIQMVLDGYGPHLCAGHLSLFFLGGLQKLELMNTGSPVDDEAPKNTFG
ncbi:hypothetical protein R0135_14015 [Congregibacter variabilis]|uniref:Uncharacterized protein n=1 Tax=Congregibacter variabilis TaxID=3081200 RepID=A0ABZ0I050_9GAMM|nr:hypothetical protein R0135_14015 [Congregibacter sp. IMCC43200]